MIKTGMYEDKKTPVTNNQYFTSQNIEEGVTTHNGSNGTLESAEMLRWRADMLLDEMLLGSAEIGGGHNAVGTPENNHLPNGSLSPSLNGNHDLRSEPFAGPAYSNHQSTVKNGVVHPGNLATAQPSPAQTNSSGAASGQSLSAAAQTSTPNHHGAQSLAAEAEATPMAESVPAAPSQPLLVSAEQRYAKNVQPLPVGVSDQNYQTPLQVAGEETNESSAGLGPVRRSMTVGAMSVGNRGSKYSTLLPRESTPDPDELLREIIALGNQLATDIPAAHESRERAQKLLDKANTILHSDPLRSAEVGYYLQQVRSMIDRLRQNFSYSALYQRRLHTYLFAWLALAVVTIFGCLLYGGDLVGLLGAISNVEGDSVVGQHLVALLLTIFAGGLGGTLGALWSMRNQTKHESFFLDRKFSLRSMILPVTGFMAGFLIYLLLGLLYWGFGFDPSHNLIIAFIPVLLTFGLASSQEIVFGVRS